jgi:hypothetical protein
MSRPAADCLPRCPPAPSQGWPTPHPGSGRRQQKTERVPGLVCRDGSESVPDDRTTRNGLTTDPRQYANFQGAGCLFTRVRDSLQFRCTRHGDGASGRVPPSSASLLDADFPDAPLDRPMSRVYYCALSGAPRSPVRMAPRPPVSADATLIAASRGEAGSVAGPR